MKILHLTDLHFGKKYLRKGKRMLPSLQTEIERINKKGSIDFVVFSGDLVYSGSELSAFQDAQNEFIDKIITAAGIQKENFILSGGNHDMDAGAEIKPITEFFERIKSNEELNEIYQKNDDTFKLSYISSKQYFEFVSGFYDKDDIQELFQVFIRQFGDKKIGFCSLHSPWRSFIGDHSGKLLLPLDVIHEGTERISDCDLKIAVIHHPIEDFRNFNSYEMEDVIFENFDVLLSGHYHKKKQSIQLTYKTGMLSVSSPATLSGEDGSTIGFTIIQIELETFDATVENFNYVKNDNVFVNTSTKVVSIPQDETKTQQIRLFKEMKRYYNNVVFDANELLVYSHEELDGRCFTDLFIEPVIREKSFAENLKKNVDNAKVNINDLLDDNHILFGKSKSGKTSILRMLQIQLLKDYKIKKQIPIYIDLDKPSATKDFSLENKIRSKFNVNKRMATSLIENESFVFLLDNYQKDSHSSQKIIDALESINDSHFVLATIETQSSTFDKPTIKTKPLKKAFIHPLSRTSIRKQADLLLYKHSPEERQDIIKRLHAVFHQLCIPFNFWTLSLFFWIYRKDQFLSINDNMDLLNLYIEKLLGREQIAVIGSDDEYQLIIRLISRIANNLLKNYSLQNYEIPRADLLTFISRFKEKNIRFNTKENDFIEDLLDRGVLIKTESDNLSFRLNGVMEYFIAYYLYEHPKKVNKLIKDQFSFLSFTNEFEILAGLNKGNSVLLKKLYLKTEAILEEVNEKYASSHDTTLSNFIKSPESILSMLKSIDIEKDVKPILFEEQDQIADDISPIQNFSESVRQKPTVEFPDGKYTHAQLEQHVFLLARVFRSLSLVDDQELMKNVFDLLLKSSINLGFELLGELNGENDGKEAEKFLLDLLSSLVPLLTQVGFTNAIVHNNLKRFFEKEISDLEKNKQDNQYKLMILYLTLLDLEVNNSEVLDKLINNISLRPLQNTIAIKLHYYYIFRTSGNVELQKKYTQAVIDIKAKLDPTENKSKIKQNLERDFLIQKNIK